MALEQLIGGKEVKAISGKEFGIDPASRYDPKEFAKRVQEWAGLEQGYRKLRQNSGDMNALDQIISVAVPYMAGDPNENAQSLRTPHLASQQSEVLLEAGKERLGKYVENNVNIFLEGCSEDALKSIAVQLPDKGNKAKEAIQKITKDLKANRVDAYIAEASKRSAYLGKALALEAARNPNLVLNLAQYRVQQLMGEAMMPFAYKLVEGDEEKAAINYGSVRRYIKSALAKSSEQERADFYFMVGTASQEVLKQAA